MSGDETKRTRDFKWFKRHFLAVLFPERCACCGQVIRVEQQVCDECRNHLLYQLPPLCTACGRSRTVCDCGQKASHYFDKIISPLVYEGAAKEGILRLKRTGYRYIAEVFAEEMLFSYRDDYDTEVFDFAVPVPMTDGEYKEKGYNHSELLAQELGSLVNLPVENGLRKVRETRPQKELTAMERRGNLAGVFDVDPHCDVKDKRILLVDDVMTTGSTLDECAKMLKIYGASEVCAVTAAITWLSEDKEEIRRTPDLTDTAESA